MMTPAQSKIMAQTALNTAIVEVRKHQFDGVVIQKIDEFPVNYDGMVLLKNRKMVNLYKSFSNGTKYLIARK
jgi:hypothetical protein